MISIYIFMILTATLTGAILGRMKGSNLYLDIPRPTEQMLFCLIFAFVLMAFDVSWIDIAIAYACSVGFVLTGHGQYFLGMMIKPIEPERFDFILKYVFGDDPRCDPIYKRFWEIYYAEANSVAYASAVEAIENDVEEYGKSRLFKRCLAGMALTGGLVTIIPGTALMTVHIGYGIALMLSGFVIKPLTYYISYKTGNSTEGAEYGNGGMQWCIGAMLMVIAIW